MASTDTTTDTGRRGNESTRISRAWVTAFVALVVLLVTAVFIAQNGQDVSVSFLVWEGTISLGLALLLATILGGLIVFLLGAARMHQMRRTTRRLRAERETGGQAVDGDGREAAVPAAQDSSEPVERR